MREPVRELAVVREQQQTLGVLIEPPHGEDTRIRRDEVAGISSPPSPMPASTAIGSGEGATSARRSAL